jgi:phytoene desaturase
MSFLIVGAGVGGLSLAALLANKEKEVTIIEKNSDPGGRARYYKENGYTFDMGPSWYIMPDIYEKYFNELELNVSDCYELVRIDPSYRIFFKDSEIIDVSSRLADNLKLFDSFESNGGTKLQQYLSKAERDYKIATEQLLMRDYDLLRNLISGRLLLDSFKLPLFGNIDSYISNIFLSEKAKRILEYSIGFIGGSPKNTPSIYYIMNYVDLNLGVWYPIGGIGKVVEKLYELCIEKGVNFFFNENVIKIKSDKGIVTGVKTSKGEHKAETVVVNADYPHSELKLLDNSKRTYNQKYWDNKLFAPSALVIYIGLSKKVENLTHHNLYLAGDWNLSFNKLYDLNDPEWPANISYYVNITSKTDQSVVPKDGETIFILVPTPEDFTDNNETRQRLYNKILVHLEKLCGEKIRGFERVKRIFGPNDFINDYNAFKGTSLGLIHTLTQSAVFRPSHRSKKIKNLYYNGHYTHPGIGLPLVLISSQILARNLLNKA